MRTRVKICGITSRQDAQMVIEAGADAIGLVFANASPRYIDSSQAADICETVPAFVSKVALFKDAEQSVVSAVLDEIDIDLIQFHGSETADFCEQFERPYIKALGMKTAEHDSDYLNNNLSIYSSARAILLDGHAPGESGGTGEVFDWAAIASITRSTSMPVILAGGLNPGNVKQAIETVNPFAVDVSSGVESSPGQKDAVIVESFMRQVASAAA